MNRIGERAKLALLCVLLLIMVGIFVFAAVNTLQAAKTFQRQYSAAKTGNVTAIHPWMTIHVIAHIYHVPEYYLYQSLNLQDSSTVHHATIYEIAARKKQTVTQVIHTIQHAILVYRKAHPLPTPTPTPKPGTHPSPTPGRPHS